MVGERLHKLFITNNPFLNTWFTHEGCQWVTLHLSDGSTKKVYDLAATFVTNFVHQKKKKQKKKINFDGITPEMLDPFKKRVTENLCASEADLNQSNEIFILSKECSKLLTTRNNHFSYCLSISKLHIDQPALLQQNNLSKFLRIFISKHLFLMKELHPLHHQGFDKADLETHFY